ncbi:hypothetical protein K502DRAFT_368425 [Neoconidiobolus thromboides FSU 785]|nr:hypothetical protein K502DRAFT_368425 [Neoconidiobolus thromboides FSU 785]
MQTYIETIISIIIFSLELIGILLSLFSIFLIYQQGYKTIDMLLISTMGICDIGLLLFTLGIWIYSKVYGDSFYSNPIFGQLNGLFISSLIVASMLSVCYLALARSWILIFKIKMNKWLFFIAYVTTILLFITPFILLAINSKYQLMPFGAYYLPSLFNLDIYSRLAYFVIFSVNITTLLILLISYTFLTRNYFSNVDSKICHASGFYKDHFLLKAKRRKIQTLIRIIIALSLYVGTILPPAVVSLKEIVTNEVRSKEEDVTFLISSCLFVIVNPLSLILLHEDSSKLAINYFYKLIRKK